MKNYLYFIILLILSFFTSSSFANHMMGGEVRYECLGNNRFKVIITLYADCLADDAFSRIAADNPAQYAIFSYDPFGNPTLLRTLSGSQNVISQRELPANFTNECLTDLPSVCMYESIYSFEVTLPPNPYGYEIVYQRCCRNYSISNIVAPGTQGVTYSAFIPGFENNECPNNSPTFSDMPPQIICKNFNFIYDYSVTDVDGDSLVYRLCYSNIGVDDDNAIPVADSMIPPPYSSVPYTFGYTFSQPFQSSPLIHIDPETGIFTSHPTQSGRFQVRVCVDEYRDGVLLNTHSRDLQFVIADCSKTVEANIPVKTSDPTVYVLNCLDYTVRFEHTSTGGFSYHWDFGDGSPESTLEFPEHTYEDTGTYIVKLIVNRGTTCADSITKKVKIYPEFGADFEYIGNLCPGDTLTVNSIIHSTITDNVNYYWETGKGDTSTQPNFRYVVDSSGEHVIKLTATNEFGCVAEATKEIIVNEFKANAGNDTTIVLGYDFQLNGSGGDEYIWSPSDYLSNPYIANPSVNFPDTGMYTFYLYISSKDGCNVTDTVNVLVVKDPVVMMPNAFSPNGDGLNDDFKPKIVGYPNVNSFRIYNRWGEEVFVSYTEKGWNGTYSGAPCDAGVYFYTLEVTNIVGERKIFKGDVTLIR